MAGWTQRIFKPYTTDKGVLSWKYNGIPHINNKKTNGWKEKQAKISKQIYKAK